tara:strand:+ start:4607 stop:4777 length:171 start_codon:yes stop_codon:yes gene_type:complete
MYLILSEGYKKFNQKCQKLPTTDEWHDEHNYLQQVVFDARNTANLRLVVFRCIKLG